MTSNLWTLTTTRVRVPPRPVFMACSNACKPATRLGLGSDSAETRRASTAFVNPLDMGAYARPSVSAAIRARSCPKASKETARITSSTIRACAQASACDIHVDILLPVLNTSLHSSKSRVLLSTGVTLIKVGCAKVVGCSYRLAHFVATCVS